jgi:uncharacterized membrane protein HdeD (DUF308 family)
MRRTGWDIALGAFLVIAGLAILGNAAFATKVSIQFIGWFLVAAGILGLVAGIFLIGKGGFWSAALSGALMVVLGLVFLRHTHAAALSGLVFLTAGIVRLMAAFHDPRYRTPLVFSGIISAALGLIVLLNLFEASYVLVGVLIGIYAITDGITMMAIGRWRIVQEPSRYGATGQVAPGDSQHPVS